jgi:hypothetical protein
VGGFGESRYLKKKLAELFDQHGASIVTAEEPSLSLLLFEPHHVDFLKARKLLRE